VQHFDHAGPALDLEFAGLDICFRVFQLCFQTDQLGAANDAFLLQADGDASEAFTGFHMEHDIFGQRAIAVQRVLHPDPTGTGSGPANDEDKDDERQQALQEFHA
jgi:hypothetical protein